MAKELLNVFVKIVIWMDATLIMVDFEPTQSWKIPCEASCQVNATWGVKDDDGTCGDGNPLLYLLS